jgi:phytoene dehydrogenase-like protein
MKKYDAVVVGSGPNGLAAAITLAREGKSVLVREAAQTIGGGMRTEALTVPGFMHDVCSAAHPMAAASPFFRALPLEKFGLEWIHSPVPLAHPLDLNGKPSSIVLKRSVEETAAQLGADETTYIALMKPFVEHFDELFGETMGPLAHLPKHPILLARFGLQALLPATTLMKLRFQTPEARALFTGVAAHSALPLTYTSSAAIGLVLSAAGHAVGWPIPRGGSGQIARAMADYFKSLGGEIETGAPVTSLRELPESRWVFLDVTPRQALPMVGERFPKMFRRKLSRFRYGPGVFKMDWALSAPIPWSSPECKTASTVHVGGTFEEMIESESNLMGGSAGGQTGSQAGAQNMGRTSEKPYILVAQPSLFDPTRAPEGKHTVWAYCHVPNGSLEDMSARIENQIERFAPGFKKLIIGRSQLNTAQLEARNANLIGGDISGGAVDFRQILFRPANPFNPYETPDPGIFFCSSSTSPGPGVHGMCGLLAAREALRQN